MTTMLTAMRSKPLLDEAAASAVADDRLIVGRFADGEALASLPNRRVVRHVWPNGLTSEMSFVFSSKEGVWRRSDRWANAGPQPIAVRSPAQRFTLVGEWAVSVWSNEWCREAQRRDLVPDGEMTIAVGSRGRSCSRYMPYVRLHSPEGGTFAFTLLTGGDWRITVNRAHSPSAIALRVDLGDEEGGAVLSPGETVALVPDCLIQEFPAGEPPERGGWRLQAHALRHLSRRTPSFVPVVYNTWFDRFHHFSWSSLTTQVQAAAECGCEVFVVDAGWFGPGSTGWERVGDWREKPEMLAPHSLRELADYVRGHGLGFGLWMEPERVHARAPARVEHPEWFLPRASAGTPAPPPPSYCYPDLTQPAARAWIMTEIVRIVEYHQLAWIKLDCNWDFSPDPYHRGHVQRLEAWYGVLDELARRFPSLTIEGCASGGGRLDLLTASHHHTNFPTDTVDPIDLLRIGMAQLAWLPPRWTAKWAVLCPAGGFARYDGVPPDSELVLCPENAVGDVLRTHALTFAMRGAMLGSLGLSGNLAGLSSGLRARVADHVAFYKRHRAFIQSAVGIPLTPVEPLECRDGLAAVQLADPEFRRSLLLLFNLATHPRSPTRLIVRPAGLARRTTYALADDHDRPVGSPLAGSDVMDRGIDLECPRGDARMWWFTQAPQSPKTDSMGLA